MKLPFKDTSRFRHIIVLLHCMPYSVYFDKHYLLIFICVYVYQMNTVSGDHEHRVSKSGCCGRKMAFRCAYVLLTSFIPNDVHTHTRGRIFHMHDSSWNDVQRIARSKTITLCYFELLLEETVISTGRSQ